MANTSASAPATPASAAASASKLSDLLKALIELIRALSGKTRFKDTAEALKVTAEEVERIGNNLDYLIQMAEDNPGLVQEVSEEAIEITQSTIDALSKDGLGNKEMDNITSKFMSGIRDISDKLMNFSAPVEIKDAICRAFLKETLDENDPVAEADMSEKPFALFKTEIDGKECIVVVKDESKRLTRNAKEIPGDEKVSFYMINEETHTFEPVDKNSLSLNSLEYAGNNAEVAKIFYDCGNLCLVSGQLAVEMNSMAMLLYNENADRVSVTKAIDDLAKKLDGIDFASLDDKSRTELITEIEKALDVSDKYLNQAVKNRISTIKEAIESNDFDISQKLDSLKKQIEKDFSDRYCIDKENVIAINSDEAKHKTPVKDFDNLEGAVKALATSVDKEAVEIIKTKQQIIKGLFDTINKPNELYVDEKNGLQAMRVKKDGLTTMRIYDPDSKTLLVTSLNKGINRHTERYSADSIDASIKGLKGHPVCRIEASETGGGKGNWSSSWIMGSPEVQSILKSELARNVIASGFYGMDSERWSQKLENAVNVFEQAQEKIVEHNFITASLAAMEKFGSETLQTRGLESLKCDCKYDSISVSSKDSPMELHIITENIDGKIAPSKVEYVINGNSLTVTPDLDSSDIIDFATNNGISAKDAIRASTFAHQVKAVPDKFKEFIKEMYANTQKTVDSYKKESKGEER